MSKKNDQFNNLKIDEQNKIYIIGGNGVGKTTFFHLIFSDKFNEDISPSKIGIIASQYTKGNTNLTIKDLTDDENFTTTKILLNELEDIILIFILFSIDNKDSYDYAKTLLEFIEKNLINNKEMNIILIGNKYDLGQNNPSLIQVDSKNVERYVNTIDNVYYYEVSCKTGFNIEELKTLINDIEVNNGDETEDAGKLTEEERRQKIEEAENSSCYIF